MKQESIGVVILSAGLSSRMLSAKALLPYDDKHNFLDKILSVYLDWGCEEIVVVLSDELAGIYHCLSAVGDKVTFVINDHPEYERFFSIQLGLQKLVKSDFCFIQNVDNPLISADILDIIARERKPDKWISPRFGDHGGHPILLPKKVIDPICNYPVKDTRLNEVLDEFPCCSVEMTDDRVLININDLQTLESYKNLFA